MSRRSEDQVHEEAVRDARHDGATGSEALEQGRVAVAAHLYYEAQRRRDERRRQR